MEVYNAEFNDSKRVFSRELQYMLDMNGFKNVRELLSIVKLENVVKIPYSGYRIYKEILDHISR